MTCRKEWPMVLNPSQIYLSIEKTACGILLRNRFLSQLGRVLVNNVQVAFPVSTRAWGVRFTILHIHVPHFLRYVGIRCTTDLHQGQNFLRFFQHHQDPFTMGRNMQCFGTCQMKNLGVCHNDTTRNQRPASNARFTLSIAFAC